MKAFKVLFIAKKNKGLFNFEVEVNSVTTNGAKTRATQELIAEGFNANDFKTPVANAVRMQGAA